jgi:hypothetical protein
MNFTEHIENLFIASRKANIEEVRKDIKKAWVQDKIANFVENWGGNFTYQQIEENILNNDVVAAMFSKDPKKQNIPEKEVEKILNSPKLPQAGKNCIRFNDDGDIVHLSTGATKSADFSYNGYYATQKYTTSAGGAQDNQKNDVIDFLKRGSIKYKVMAIVDGDYWDIHRSELKSLFADNDNVVITSITELT